MIAARALAQEAGGTPLDRAAALLRCPSCRRRSFSGSIDAEQVACTGCGRIARVRDGYLDLMERLPVDVPAGERVFLWRAGARLYERFRESRIGSLMTGMTFDEEVHAVHEPLDLVPSACVLDVPCGQGNFTVELCRRVPEGLVIGADLSPAMLGRAVLRARREGVRNVFFVRADALDLPIADAAFDAVSTCGGLHLYPDVGRAIAEMRRVLRPGGAVGGLTFAERGPPFVAAVARRMMRALGVTAFRPMELRSRFEGAGFSAFEHAAPRAIVYFRARV